jgi:chloramphenicol O-acetyltransferase
VIPSVYLWYLLGRLARPGAQRRLARAHIFCSFAVSQHAPVNKIILLIDVHNYISEVLESFALERFCNKVSYHVPCRTMLNHQLLSLNSVCHEEVTYVDVSCPFVTG